MKGYNPLQTAYSRVFLIEGRARGDHAPTYQSQLKMAGVSQGLGDVTKIEIPDPDNYGKFIEVDSVRGASERITTSLMGRYASSIRSYMLELAGKGCSFDVQLHAGKCTDPSTFNVFNKTIILEDVIVTNYGTDDLGALSSDEQNPINETADISAKKIYEVLPLSMSSKAADLVLNEVKAIAIIDTQSCGDCGTSSDGSMKLFAVTVAAGGSPATLPDIIFSLDKGLTWYAHDIETITSGDANGVDGVGDYIVVIGTTKNSISIALKTDFNGVIDPTFTEVTTGFVAGKTPRAIKSVGRKAFIAASGGYVYYTDDPAAGVSVLTNGGVTPYNLVAIDATSDTNAVAVGDHGAIIYTTNRVDWQLAGSTPVGINITLNAIKMKSDSEWWIGASNGKLYYTTDSGDTWTQKVLPGTTPTAVTAIGIATDSVMYVAATVSAKGKLYRSFDSGYSFAVLPESVGTLPACDKLNAITCNSYDVNFVAAAGLGDDATDGIIIVGQD